MNAQGEIVIPFVNFSNTLHEAHHGYQHLTGDLEYVPASGGAMYADLWDERSSYIRQYIYDPASVTNIGNSGNTQIKRATDITVDYISKMYYVDNKGQKVFLYQNGRKERKTKE